MIVLAVAVSLALGAAGCVAMAGGISLIMRIQDTGPPDFRRMSAALLTLAATIGVVAAAVLGIIGVWRWSA